MRKLAIAAWVAVLALAVAEQGASMAPRTLVVDPARTPRPPTQRESEDDAKRWSSTREAMPRSAAGR
jgi:hypothetical protein